MSSRAQGRHRAAVRPKTPLSTLATQVTASAGTVGRRGAVLAASSGLVVSLGVSAADAAPVVEFTGGTDAADTTEKPRVAPVATAPAPVEADLAPVTAAADVVVPVSALVDDIVAPPPPPEPEPEPERVTRTSRSSERSSSSSSSAQESAPAEATGNLSASRANVLAVAARYVGVPYRYGGTSPSGFDCSGYVQYVFAQVGVSLPRTSGAQASAGVRISRSEAQPGDLVARPGHVGIYAGGNMMYDAPSSGGHVSKREMWTSDFQFYRVLGG